jgi:hypothetical protein
MGKLKAKQRKALKTSQFAIPSRAKSAKAKAKSGNYPIPDRAHARAALRLVGMHGSPAEKARVRAAVRRKFPGISQKGKKK